MKLGFPDTEPGADGISTAEQWKARLIRRRDRTEPGGQDRVKKLDWHNQQLAQQLIRYKELSTPEAVQASLQRDAAAHLISVLDAYAPLIAPV